MRIIYRGVRFSGKKEDSDESGDSSFQEIEMKVWRSR